jgi:acetylornithine deacetylase/succinyl-diaminopimelate desuccinylase-like protein
LPAGLSKRFEPVVVHDNPAERRLGHLEWYTRAVMKESMTAGRIACWAVLACLSMASQVSAQPAPPALTQSARDLLRDLIAINTAEPEGSTTPAAERVAGFLRSAGFPAEDVQVIGSDAKRRNLVARLRGRGAGKPVLFLAHLDVVPALRADWTTDPYSLVEKDGYYYGRGTTDDKQFCAIFAAVFAQLKREGFVPNRDLVLALTAGEETGYEADTNGVVWLLKNHRPMMDVDYVINGDAGGGSIAPDGRYRGFGVQAGEKLYADFSLEVTNPGGHSSRPVKDNAIYRLARALSRVETLALPIRVTELTRPFLAFLATVESGDKARDLRAAAAASPDVSALARLAETDPSLNAQLRTTCVATQLSAGHAPNALPQRARANVNCRILPDERVDDVRAALVRVIDDPEVSVRHDQGQQVAPAVRLDQAVMDLIAKAAAAVWPGVPVMPVLEVGGTDGFYFRQLGVDVYGLNHFERDEDKRAHGKDERIGVKQFDEAAHFGYVLAGLAAAR